MPRSSQLNKMEKNKVWKMIFSMKKGIDSPHPNPKGQWFLISAVFISGAFLLISIVFKDYFIVDQSAVMRMNEDFYFHNIKEGLNGLVNYTNCDEMIENMDEFIFFSKQKMAEKGYYLYITKNVDCIANTTSFGILLASDKMIVYENVNPEDILPITTTTSTTTAVPTTTTMIPTCYDGIQNRGEEGIDCGGPCPPCISDENICRNAENADLCDGLDIAFGAGYKCACCTEHLLCCPC